MTKSVYEVKTFGTLGELQKYLQFLQDRDHHLADIRSESAAGRLTITEESMADHSKVYTFRMEMI